MSRSRLASALIAGLALISCSTAIPAASPASGPATSAAPRKAAARPTTPALVSLPSPGSALPSPAALVPFAADRGRGAGAWTPAGRAIGGGRAVYETTLIPPGGIQPAGIAWMDTGLLSARLYSGSVSPGGGPYRYTAPVMPAQARTLVAAFNGGFKMNDAHGGYYTEGRMIDPLRPGVASLVIYADGTINLSAWSSDVTMTRHQPRLAGLRDLRSPAGRARCPIQRPQAAFLDHARPSHVLRSLVGPRLRDDVGAPSPMTAPMNQLFRNAHSAQFRRSPAR
jgi:hypothetical protein